MGFIFDYKASREYDHWYRDPKNRFVADLEDQLMLRLVSPQKGERLLDIGCGTGRHLLMFAEMGLSVTGLDASAHMLELARKRLRHRAELHEGIAEDLPFEDNSFDIAIMVTTLEFVDDTRKAIAEACRVTKDRLFIGVLNRYAPKAIERRINGIFFATIYNRAQFFSVWGLTRQVRDIVGKTHIRRRTVHHLPAFLKTYSRPIERCSFVQKSPFGTFIGLVVDLMPRFRTQPLTIEYVRNPRSAVSGLMQNKTHPQQKGV